MSNRLLPLSTPQLDKDDFDTIKKSLVDGWVSSSGPDIFEFEKNFSKKININFSISTMNGTSALHIGLLALGIGKGHDVILPNITFVASINSIIYTGASPFIVDIEPKSLGICPISIKDTIEKYYDYKSGVLINKRNGNILKCIMPVHMLGYPAEMKEIVKIAKKYNLYIIEDAAESLGAKYYNNFTGCIGDIGCFSFNGNKIITTGGGGMIVTNSDRLAKRCKHLTTTAKTNPFTYEHDMVGYNYRMVNILASLGIAQLKKLDCFLEKKKEIHETYKNLFKNIVSLDLHTETRKNILSSYWLNLLHFKNDSLHQKEKIDIVKYFREKNIETRPFWQPLSTMHHLKKYQRSKLDVSLSLWGNSLMLPSCVSISKDELERVQKIILEFII